MIDRPVRVTAVAATAELGGPERVLMDLARHAAHFDVDLRILTPIHGPMLDRCRVLGVEVDVVPGSKGLLRASQKPGRLLSIPKALGGLASWSSRLSKHPFLTDTDLAYTIAFKAHSALALARQHPVVWHVHDFPPRTTGNLWFILSRTVPDAIVANSSPVSRAWSLNGTGKRSVQVIPNGVDLEKFQPAGRTGWIHEELGIPEHSRLIGMPAVFAEWKGQREVLEAFRLIRHDHPDLSLVFVGGTFYRTDEEREYEGMLRAAIAESGTRVYLLRFQENIERVYPELDITLHYSRRPEPFGRVVLESMACGVPVIAAAEGGPMEIHGATAAGQTPYGWLVTPRDPVALAATLNAALRMGRAELATKGHAGRERAVARYSSKRFAEALCRVFRNIGAPKE